MRRSVLIAGMALLAAWSSEASANLITNGGFEANGGVGTSTFAGWTANAGVSVDGFFPNTGNFDAVFTAIPPGTGSLQQTIATPGTNYLLSFALNNQSTDFLANASFIVSFDGVQVASFDATANFGLGSYFAVSLPVSTLSALTQLSFDGFNDSGDWNLDDVSVVSATVVPEPPSIFVLGGILAVLLLYPSLRRPGATFRKAD